MGNWEEDTLKEIMAENFPICKQTSKKDEFPGSESSLSSEMHK